MAATVVPISRTYLHLLGGFELTTGSPMRVAPGNNARRLLSLLALRGPLPRTQIASTLWPEADDDTSGRLRTVLWRFKPGRQLLCEADGRLSLSPHVVVDVDEMRTAALGLTSESPQNPDTELSIEPSVTRVFEADLLPGWSDEWLIVDRERVRQLRLHALEALATRRLRAGRYAAALDAALAAVQAEPLRESAHACVIDAHLAEGNVAEARRQYETCREILATELSVEPSYSLRDRMIRDLHESVRATSI